MKNAYISYLPKTMSGGPKYIVPNQVNSQAHFDEVIWINNLSPWGLTNNAVPCENITIIKDVISRVLDWSPDLVVFEDLYYLEFYKIGKQLRKKD